MVRSLVLYFKILVIAIAIFKVSSCLIHCGLDKTPIPNKQTPSTLKKLPVRSILKLKVTARCSGTKMAPTIYHHGYQLPSSFPDKTPKATMGFLSLCQLFGNFPVQLYTGLPNIRTATYIRIFVSFSLLACKPAFALLNLQIFQGLKSFIWSMYNKMRFNSE